MELPVPTSDLPSAIYKERRRIFHDSIIAFITSLPEIERETIEKAKRAYQIPCSPKEDPRGS